MIITPAQVEALLLEFGLKSRAWGLSRVAELLAQRLTALARELRDKEDAETRAWMQFEAWDEPEGGH